MFPVERALPQRELCAFILLKLNTKAVETPGLFCQTLQTERLLECVPKGGNWRQQQKERNILSEEQIFMWRGLFCFGFFCGSPQTNAC